MNNGQTERLQSILTAIIIAAAVIIAFGAAFAPALLTYHYGWKWSLCYPALFILMMILSARNRKNRS